MTTPLKQMTAVSLMNLHALKERWGAALIIVFGMASVVGVTVSILSMSVGIVKSMDTYRRPDRVMVRSANSEWEFQSNIPRAAAIKIADLPQIKKDREGKPLSSAEILVFIPATKKADGLERGLAIRAGTPNLFEFRPEFKLVEGRAFTAGLHELVVGRRAQEALEGLELGAQVTLPDGPWTVVGVYDSQGQGDWALFGDGETLLPVFRRTTFQSLTAVLEDINAFDAFKAALAADPTLDVVAERETEYWGRWLEPQEGLFNVIAYGVGGIMGVGVLFATLNIMYAAVSARTAEIGTLRAIGYGPGSIVASVFSEALLLAGIGAAIGITAAWFGFNGHYNVKRGFYLVVDLKIALLGVSIALLFGGLAALFPAIRAARLPLTEALKAR